jgi:glycosyltransferase involved in cell wall biosynthesis
MNAFQRLKHPCKEFLIVGPKTQTTGLEGMSIPDHVRFTGILKGYQLEQAYASASAFVLPTIEEGLALVQGEAMAAGLPLITTSHSGAEDIMTHGVEGFIVPPCDSDALVDAFQCLADDPVRLKKMGAAASSKAKDLGGWDAYTRKLIELFRDLLASS